MENLVNEIRLGTQERDFLLSQNAIKRATLKENKQEV